MGNLSFDMMTTFNDIINTNMTLVIAIHNNSEIVVGADSLRGDAGTGEIFYNARKLYKITDNLAVLVAGNRFNSGAVDQFLRDFTYEVNEVLNLVSFTDIAEELQRRARVLIGGGFTGDLVFLIAGFNETTPVVKYIQHPSFNFASVKRSYLAAGKDQFAYQLCESIGIDESTPTDELELAVNQVLLDASGEFPNEVGGDMTVEILTPVI